LEEPVYKFHHMHTTAMVAVGWELEAFFN